MRFSDKMLILILVMITLDVVGARLVNMNCGDIPKQSYDYIIAGAGTAGSVIASRLSENPNNTVLVLEAGGNDEDFSAMKIPAIRFSIADDAFWNYEPEPQQNGRTFPERSGRVLGGTSSVNAMAYFRGFSSEYDLWQSMGADGWSYNDVLPYFLKSEGTKITEYQNSSFHNTCGPLTVTTINMTPPVEAWFQAAKELGIPEVDCNQPRPLGICRGQLTIKSGERESTSTAFLKHALDRPNLDVITSALVTKVLTSKRPRRTDRVQFLHNGTTYDILANKEVVLSAGGYGTPKILLLSGIGPRKQLKKFGIKVRSNLPVGENLQNSVLLVGKLFIDIHTVTPEDLKNPEVMAQYMFRREGLFAERTSTDASLYFQKTSNSTNPLPEFQIVFQEGVRFGLQPVFKRSEGLVDQHKFTLLIFLLHPKSRGTVQLRSTNPTDHPKIDLGLLTIPDDAKDLAIAIQRIESFLQAPSLKAINAKFEPEPLVNCSNRPFGSLDYWECFVRFRAESSGHPVGTCKMGNVSDVTTVVDPALRVKGIRGLRIADTSIIPEVAGMTYAGAVMIGEKAADLIKTADQGLSK